MVLPDFGLGRIGHLGIVVRDIKASIEAYWGTLGIGPWKVYLNGSPPIRNVIYHGRPASYRVRLALAHSDSLMVELIEYLEGDTIHRDFLTTHPEFEVDPSYERLATSYCHSGFLRRTGPTS